MGSSFIKRIASAMCALAIFVCAAAPAALAAEQENGIADDIFNMLTLTQARQMQQVDELIAELTESAEYEAMQASERLEAALAKLRQLITDGLVLANSIYIDEDSGMISFSYTCGALGGVLYEQQEDGVETFALPLGQDVDGDQLAAALEAGGYDQSTAEENGLLESMGGRREFLGSAVIYYAFDDVISSTRYPYYAYMQAYWTTLGFTTQLKTGVTVRDLRGMGEYDLCVLSAHGSYYTYSASYFSNELTTTPVILLLEKSSVFKDMLYGFDLLSHRVIKVNGQYCVTPDFFRVAYSGGQLENTIVISETCEFLGVTGSEDSSMAEALLAGGAKAVLGYVNNVYAVYARSMLWDTVNHLIVGYPLSEALDHSLKLYGENDLIWYTARGGQRPHAQPSYPVIYGNENATLYSSVYQVDEAA